MARVSTLKRQDRKKSKNRTEMELRNREENQGEAKNYMDTMHMMAAHWRPRARLRDISPKIKFIRQDANRVFIGHIASQGGNVCFSRLPLNNRIRHDDRAQSLYSADVTRYLQEFISDSLVTLDYDQLLCHIAKYLRLLSLDISRTYLIKSIA